MSATRAGASGQSSRRTRVQAPAVEVLHRDVEQAVGLGAEVEDLDRVGVIQARRGLRLPVESSGEGGVVGVLAVHHLDGDGLLEGDLSRPEDGAHRAAADEVLDHVFAGDRSPDEEVVVGLLHPCAIVAGSRRLERRIRRRTIPDRPERPRGVGDNPARCGSRALLRRLDEGLGDRIRPGGEERLVDGDADVVELELEPVEVLVQPLPRGSPRRWRTRTRRRAARGGARASCAVMSDAGLGDGVERPLRLVEAVPDRAREAACRARGS